MSADSKQPRGLFDGLCYNFKSLPNMARRKCPITVLLKSQQKTLFTLSLRKSQPNRSSLFSVLNAVFKCSRPFYLLCDANTDGLGVTLKQKQPDGSICLMVYIRRSTLRQSAELNSYSTRSGMRCVEYPAPSPLFIQRVLHNLHGPRVPSTNKQSR